MRRAAFFDLDGTLLAANSAALWVRHQRRLGQLSKRAALRAMVFYAAYRLSVMDIEQAMREALATVRGTEESALRAAVVEWYRDEVAHRAAPGAFPVVQQHRAAGDFLVLITSSSLYASELAQAQFGLDEVLCTRYEVEGGRFTGEPLRPFCFGEGKVTMAEALASSRGIDLEGSSFYTDSYTDLPLLLRVGTPRVVNPDPRLRLEARRRGWRILDWRDEPADLSAR